MTVNTAGNTTEATNRGRSRHSSRERGSALVEAAFVTPLFLLLIFGIFELGFLLRNYLVVTSATGATVRAATVAGSGPDADFIALRTLEHGLGSVPLSDVEAIIIYRIDNPDDPIPPACLSNPIPAGSPCNRYTASDFFLPYYDATGARTDHWGCGPTSRDQGWCPTSRKSAVSDPPDHVGVYVKVRHKYMTGLIGDERPIESTKTGRLEPSEN